MPLGEAGKADHLTLTAPEERQGSSAHATVSVNSLGALDLLQIAVSGLAPEHSYTLWLTASQTSPFGTRQALVTFKTNLSGAQVAQTVGPLRRFLSASDSSAAELSPQRFLLITERDRDNPELVQSQANIHTSPAP